MESDNSFVRSEERLIHCGAASRDARTSVPPHVPPRLHLQHVLPVTISSCFPFVSRFSSPAAMAAVLRTGRRAFTPTRLRPPVSLRCLSTRAFPTIDHSQKIEEETLSSYRPINYYPARIGQVLNSQYQIITKFCYGVASTVWLCRDLQLVLAISFCIRSDYLKVNNAMLLSKSSSVAQRTINRRHVSCTLMNASAKPRPITQEALSYARFSTRLRSKAPLALTYASSKSHLL